MLSKDRGKLSCKLLSTCQAVVHSRNRVQRSTRAFMLYIAPHYSSSTSTKIGRNFRTIIPQYLTISAIFPAICGFLSRNFFRDISEMSPQVSGGTVYAALEYKPQSPFFLHEIHTSTLFMKCDSSKCGFKIHSGNAVHSFQRNA